VLSYIWNQIEQGVGCPLGMTYAAYPGLAQPEFGAWREKILSTRYDGRPPPLGGRPACIGYADREAGRLDLRWDADHPAAETTKEGRVYLLTGQWFFRAGVGRVLHAGSCGRGRRS
jgi:putative acyl-CoA dehydrogenase